MSIVDCLECIKWLAYHNITSPHHWPSLFQPLAPRCQQRVTRTAPVTEEERLHVLTYVGVGMVFVGLAITFVGELRKSREDLELYRQTFSNECRRTCAIEQLVKIHFFIYRSSIKAFSRLYTYHLSGIGERGFRSTPLRLAGPGLVTVGLVLVLIRCVTHLHDIPWHVTIMLQDPAVLGARVSGLWRLRTGCEPDPPQTQSSARSLSVSRLCVRLVSNFRQTDCNFCLASSAAHRSVCFKMSSLSTTGDEPCQKQTSSESFREIIRKTET